MAAAVGNSRTEPRGSAVARRSPGLAEPLEAVDAEMIDADLFAEVGGEARERRARGLHRDLLPDEGAEHEFVRIEAARHSDARCGSDRRREHRVGAERLVDGHRVGVEVEQASHPGDERRQVGEGREPGIDVDRG